jgi:electron transfer flavoprotein alpha subunit
VPPIEAVAVTLSDRDLAVDVTSREASERGGISLADAKVVVGGGRGVGSTEGFADLEELAALLGGAVGGSRVVTSAGWRPHADQIGQTGLRIAPDLYIASGISGAIQHIVGCKAAKHILAINTDPEAPIMGVADYAVIGDLHTIIPAISAEIRRRGAARA